MYVLAIYVAASFMVDQFLNKIEPVGSPVTIQSVVPDSGGYDITGKLPLHNFEGHVSNNTLKWMQLSYHPSYFAHGFVVPPEPPMTDDVLSQIEKDVLTALNQYDNKFSSYISPLSEPP